MLPRLHAVAAIAALCLCGAGAALWAGSADHQQSAPAPRASPARGTPPAVGQPAPPATGLIAGRVTAVPGDAALARARVVLTSPALADSRVTQTSADGQYAMPDLPPGEYAVTASKAGFVAETFSDAEGDHATAVRLTGGQRTTVNFALAREGVISGRILDEDGTPFEGARVEVLHPQYSRGQQILAVIGRATTDDRGAFRIGGLRAGLHYVSAADPAFDNAGSDAGPLSYSPTYHPGVTFPEEATTVRVEPGRETSGIEFRLRLVRPVSVTGRIAAADSKLLLAGSVIMAAQHEERLSPVPVRDVTIRPDGMFVFRNVTPGRYVIRARGETERQGVSLFGTFVASVEGGDLAGINIPLTPGAIAEGRLEFDGPKHFPLTGAPTLRVRAVSTDGVVFGDAFSDPLESGGRVLFRGIMPGEHVFRMEGLPEGWVLKGVFLHGRDITDVPVYFDSGQPESNLQIVISDAVTTISGFVRGQGGAPRPDSTVTVFAVDPGRWQPYSRHVAIVRPALDASYRIRGLPPAAYWIIATQEIESGDLLDPASLERLAAGAQRLTLGMGESKTIDLRIGGAGSPAALALAGAGSR